MDSRPSDESLLLAVAERDLGAFRTLYERHAGWLTIRLARRCNDRDLVAAVVGQLSTPVPALRQVSYVTAPVRPPGQATPGRRAGPGHYRRAGRDRAGRPGRARADRAGWKSLTTSDAIFGVGAVAGSIAYAALGALIVRRAGNLVGWFMLAEGAASVVMITGSAYAIFGMKAHPGTLPAAAATGALAEAAFVLMATNLAALFLVFPTGRLPSPRWRPAALAGLGLTGLTLAAFVVSTRRVALPAPGGISLIYPNPLAVRSLQPVTRLGTLNGLALVFPLLLGACAGIAGAPLPPRRPAAAPADEVAGAGHRRSAGQHSRRKPGHRGRPG